MYFLKRLASLVPLLLVISFLAFALVKATPKEREANALGTGVLESAAWLGFLPPIAERLIGERLLLPEVATWWLGEKPALDYVLANLDRLVIKPAYPNQRFEPMFGRDFQGAEREELIARLRNRPYAYVAQEHVQLSLAPVWKPAAAGQAAARAELGARALTIRLYAVVTPDGIRVMPGGLARVATGSPFPETPQCNNVYVFPGVGLGVVAADASRVTDGMFDAAASAVAGLAPPDRLLPPLERIREVSRAVALAVAQAARSEGIARVGEGVDLGARIAALVWDPRYVRYRLRR